MQQQTQRIDENVALLAFDQLAAMCGWPPAGKGFPRVLIEPASCGHVSGLLVRLDMAAGPDGNRGSRTESFPRGRVAP